jgi:hypothetical protein
LTVGETIHTPASRVFARSRAADCQDGLPGYFFKGVNAVSARKSIGKKVRFEVFKRDRFTCQYCGQSAPDVVLHVDHIDPVSNGGTNDVVNLVTSCQSCNLGKGKRLLDDRKAVEIQREHLAAIEQRREQLKMMLDWRTECADFEAEQVDAVDTIIRMRFLCTLSPQGRLDVAKLIKKFGMQLVLDSAQSACDYYKDADVAVSKIGGICVCKKRDKESPGMGKFSYIRAILKNRCNYVNEGSLKDWMQTAFSLGIAPETLIDIAKQAKSWTAFKDGVFELCCEHSEEYRSKHATEYTVFESPFEIEEDSFDILKRAEGFD